MTHTLLLNSWMQPHRIVTWQTAIVMLFSGKIEILEEYDEVVRSPSMSMRIPAVARLVKAFSYTKRGIRFSRLNVLIRDDFSCQYCGKKLPIGQLNQDHLVPKRRGGKTAWENIVASCYACNTKKADRTPEEAGMRLKKRPVRPASLPLVGLVMMDGQVPEPWTHYIGMP